MVGRFVNRPYCAVPKETSLRGWCVQPHPRCRARLSDFGEGLWDAEREGAGGAASKPRDGVQPTVIQHLQG